MVTLDNFVLIAWPRAGDVSFKCLPYQLSMVSDLPTMVVTGLFSAETIPLVTVPDSPSGEPNATTGSPIANLLELPTVIILRFARQYRYEPPPEFPLASPYSGIVHHLSGPNKYALTQTFHRRSWSVDAAPFGSHPYFTFIMHLGLPPSCSHTC